MKPPYKSSNGNYFTGNLFVEYQSGIEERLRVIEPPFTLNRDVPGKINFGRHYVQSRDPTGYTTAMELLGEYRHWMVLEQADWFQKARALWDKELDALLESEGLTKIRELAKEGQPAQALVAAKYLADKQFRKEKITSRGRPSKGQLERETKRMAASEKEIEADLKRVMGGE